MRARTRNHGELDRLRETKATAWLDADEIAEVTEAARADDREWLEALGVRPGFSGVGFWDFDHGATAETRAEVALARLSVPRRREAIRAYAKAVRRPVHEIEAAVTPPPNPGAVVATYEEMVARRAAREAAKAGALVLTVTRA